MYVYGYAPVPAVPRLSTWRLATRERPPAAALTTDAITGERGKLITLGVRGRPPAIRPLALAAAASALPSVERVLLAHPPVVPPRGASGTGSTFGGLHARNVKHELTQH